MSAKKKRRRSRTRTPGSARAREQQRVRAAEEQRPSADQAALAPEAEPQEASMERAEGFRAEPRAERAEAPPPEAPPTAPPERKEPARRGLFSRLGQAQASPYPPLGVSLGRGFLTTGAAPVIVAVAFASVLIVWGAFVAMGVEPSPKNLVMLMALSPVHVFFDAQAILLVSGDLGTFGALGLVVAMGLVRAVSFGLLGLLLVDAVRGERPKFRPALTAVPRVAAALWAIYIAQVAVVLAVPFLLQGIGGPGLAAISVPLVLVLGLHFLVLAPVIAVSEGASPREALRRSIRAARLPGIRHFALAGGYFAFVLWVFSIVPASATTSVTPSIVAWAIALAVTFIHIGVYGALAYRWLVVRSSVSKEPAPSKAR